jgi:hypothetical protein
MKFKDLTEKQKKKLSEIYNSKEYAWDVKEEMLAKYTGKSSRTARKWCEKLGLTNPKEIKSPQYESAKNKKLNKQAKRFIITWAQNDTPVHKGFLKNLEAYAEEFNADIHVIAGRYKNPTSVFEDKAHDSWAQEIMPYLDAGRHSVHKHMTIMSDYKISPTATNPMTGLRGDTGDNSCVFGHPRVQMEMVPVLDGHAPKMMMTTGACTKSNYTDSKAGKKGDFHHTLGFVVVEIKNKEVFYTRQVTATSNGDFNDLYHNVSKGVITRNTEVDAAVLGDIHLGQTDPAVMKETLKLFKKLKPKHTVIHDLFDGHSINHHESKNPIAQFKKEKDGSNSLKREIDYMIDWLDTMRKFNLIIVRSNHDDFVDRWIINSDWKLNVKNALEYMEYTRVLLQDEAPKGIIPYIIDSHFDDITTLGRDQGYQVNGWEIGYHGDMGSGGSRGTLQQYRNLSTKTITGHSHSPGRKDGSLAVGTSTVLRMGYNKGASGWLQSHVILHSDGKCQHIHFIEGGFTTMK